MAKRCKEDQTRKRQTRIQKSLEKFEKVQIFEESVVAMSGVSCQL